MRSQQDPHVALHEDGTVRPSTFSKVKLAAGVLEHDCDAIVPHAGRFSLHEHVVLLSNVPNAASKLSTEVRDD